MRRSALRHAIEPGLQVEQLARREEGIDVELLRHDADGARDSRGSLVEIEAPDLDLARGLDDQLGQDVDQGGLAGAVGAEQAEQPAARDRQIDALQRLLGGALAAGGISLVEAANTHGIGGKHQVFRHGSLG